MRKFFRVILILNIVLSIFSPFSHSHAETSPEFTNRVPLSTEIISGNNSSVNLSNSTDLHASPVMFIENVGQFDSTTINGQESGVLYQVPVGNNTISFTEDAFWVTVFDLQSTVYDRQPGSSLASESGTTSSIQGVNIKLSFVNANPHPRLEPFNRQETLVNYFIGNDRENWQTDVPVWGGVRYKDLYPGIDLEVANKDGHVVQRLAVSEGADLTKVKLRVDGANQLTLENGLLHIYTAIGEYRMPLLQVIGSGNGKLPNPIVVGDEVLSPFNNRLINYTKRVPVSMNHKVLNDANRPLFNLNDGNQTEASTDLLYSTYLGGSEDLNDYAYDIAVDASGAAYVAGITACTSFPITPGAFDTSFNTFLDAYVVKMSPDGSALTYATFLGGNGNDRGYGIAVDSSGTVYVAGVTSSSNFPTTVGAYETSYLGSSSYIAKINPAGSALMYSTYLTGGTANVITAYDISIDTDGAAYITGETTSARHTTPGAFDTSFNGYTWDAFIAKLNPEGSALIYMTLLGGNYEDHGLSIAVDPTGAAYITGSTSSTTFPATPGTYDTSPNGNDDVFIAKLNIAGSDLVYATYLGGSFYDQGRGIVIDSSGVVYVTGITGSNGSTSNFPTTTGAYDTSFNGGTSEAFVAILTVDGSTLNYGSLIGGNSTDYASDLSIDSSGSLYITGYTTSYDFPTTTGAFTGGCAFVMKMTPVGSGISDLQYSTFLGGSADDIGIAIALDPSRMVYVAGFTQSANFPTTTGAFDTTMNGNQDSFVAKLWLGGTIRVNDESGEPVGGAQVYRNGVLAGITAVDGILSIPGMTNNDKLVARLRVIEVSSGKNSHIQDSSQNWAYRVYITSLDVPQSSDPAPWIVTNPTITQTLTLKQSNPLIGFNIVASVDWDANSSYLNELQQGFLNASNYLYDASDGQMLFEWVTIYDNNQNMGDADYQIRASNQQWPEANPSGIWNGNSQHVYLGRYFNGQSSNQGSWIAADGYRTMIHELGHYGLGLYDSYFYYDNNKVKRYSNCTSAAIRTNQSSNTNATLMDWQYTASEFSMINVPGLWSSQCLNTDQWKINGQSDWETIVEHYRDANSITRWVLKTPAAYGGVVSGPNTQLINGWSTAVIGSDASTGVCEPPLSLSYETSGNMIARGASIVLHKGDRSIAQGHTDDNGEIVVFGASNGDKVVASMSSDDNLLWQKSIQVNCSAPSQNQAASYQPIKIILEPAPFMLEITPVPSANSNQVMIIVSTSAGLSSAPETYLTQNSAPFAVLVPLNYDDILQAYVGTATLDADLPLSGDINTLATNTIHQTMEINSQFVLEPVATDQDITVWSTDGQAEFYLPTNSLSVDGRVSIVLGQITSSLPDNLIFISGPYTIHGDEGMALVNNASLTLRYLDVGGTLSHVDVSSAQIYILEGHNWRAISSISSPSDQMVSATIDSFGTYALMAVRQEKIFLPLLIR
jgi:hypothetical protein